jgi:hypothetical protein
MGLEGTDPRISHQDFSLQAKGLKRLQGMELFERLLRQEAAEPRLSTERAAPGR